MTLLRALPSTRTLDMLMENVGRFNAYGDMRRSVNEEDVASLASVYSVDRSAAAVGDLSASTHRAWRFCLSHGGLRAIADIVVAKRGLRFSLIWQGRLAERYCEVLGMVQAFGEAADERLTLRVLEVPSLQQVTLWLHGQTSDQYFDVIRRGKVAVPAAMHAGEFARQLVADAAVSERETQNHIPARRSRLRDPSKVGRPEAT